jgi:MSHA biogenesis protein MshK
MRGFSVYKITYLSAVFMCCLVSSAQAQIADPTKPLNFSGAVGVVGDAAQDTIRLTSILISSDRKVAIINGQVLQENQTLKGVGAQLKKIDADAVTLQQNGKVWRVPLNNTAIRK